MNILNKINILSPRCDKRTTFIKITVLIENSARADIELDSASAISGISIKHYGSVFPNHKIFQTDF